MSNWIEDRFGNKWHKCKLGADCGLKVIEGGKTRCWCQDQEASRCEVQAAREEIAKLEDDNDRLREEIKKEKIDRSLDGWNEAAIINELKRENAALRKAIDAQADYQRELRADRDRLDWLEKARPIAWALGSAESGEYWLLTDIGEKHPEEAEEFATLRAAIDAARKEAQP